MTYKLRQKGRKVVFRRLLPVPKLLSIFTMIRRRPPYVENGLAFAIPEPERWWPWAPPPRVYRVVELASRYLFFCGANDFPWYYWCREHKGSAFASIWRLIATWKVAVFWDVAWGGVWGLQSKMLVHAPWRDIWLPISTLAWRQHNAAGEGFMASI